MGPVTAAAGSGWPAEPFTPRGRTLLESTKTFLVQQKFIRTDFELDDWIVARS
jgi:hypothetical protein